MALSPSSIAEEEASSKPPLTRAQMLERATGTQVVAPVTKARPLILRDASYIAEAFTGPRPTFLSVRTLNTSDLWPLRMAPHIISMSAPHRVPLPRKPLSQWIEVRLVPRKQMITCLPEHESGLLLLEGHVPNLGSSMVPNLPQTVLLCRIP